MNRSISVTMFILMWLNSIKLLMVFYATRYMIRLITELIFGLNGFLIILLMSIAAYCQIVAHYFAVENSIGDGIGETSFSDYIFDSIKGGYGLIYGQFPEELSEYTSGQYIVLAIFAFALPLVMMNMLIANMGSTYERVQNQYMAADAKGLVQLLLEVDKLIQLVLKLLKKEINES